MTFLSRLLKSLVIAAVMSGLAMTASIAASSDAQFSAAQKAAIGQIVKSYLLKNPEVVRQALIELQKRDRAAAVKLRHEILTNLHGPLYASPHEAIVGNPKGKVTLIEFFDYNCTYCKATLPDIVRLIKEDPDLRVILKDYPILSQEDAGASEDAAEIATALRYQFSGKKFWAFHQKLLSSRSLVGRKQALAVAKELGANMNELLKDAAKPAIKKQIRANLILGKDLMLNGTPSFVIGEHTIDGAVGFKQLKASVDNVRKCGKLMCS